jgi:hypothetical protein
MTYVPLNNDRDNQNFTGIYVPPVYRLSGYVKDSGNLGVSSVTITLTGATSMMCITNSTGYYEFTNLSSGNYTVIPPSYNFIPSSYVYISLTQNFSGQNFILSPINFNFRLGTDNWQFPNTKNNMWPYGAELFPDWDLFVEAFGASQVYLDRIKGIKKPSAEQKWKKIQHYWGGSCFGFAITSFLFYDNKLGLTTKFPGATNLYAVPVNDLSRRLINVYFLYQFGVQQQQHMNENWNTKTPLQTLNEIKQMFMSDIRNDRILIFFNNNPKETGGHAVVPYKIEKDTMNICREYVYVYDNNFPNDTNCRIMVDYSSATSVWDYPRYANWGGTKNLFLMNPISNYTTNPVLPARMPSKERWIMDSDTRTLSTGYIEIYNPPDCNINITNSSGSTISCNSDELFSNLTDGMPIIPLTGQKQSPIGYFLPMDSYNIQMTSYSDTTTSFSIFSDSVVFSYTRQNTDSLQKDVVNYENNRNLLTVSGSNSQSTNFSLQTIMKEPGQEKVFNINNNTMSQNESLSFKLENENLNIVNNGQVKSYDLQIRVVSNDKDIVFEHKNITIERFSSQKIVPDWNNMQVQPVAIQMDNNMDGIPDETVVVDNENQNVSPPQELSNIIVYPNPSRNGARIAFLGLPVASKIEIFTLLGELVTVLGDNGSGEAFWDPSDVASGIYLYVVNNNGKKSKGKLGVIK